MAKPLNLGETFMRRLLAIALALGVFATSSLARAEDTIVFAAASTKDVIGDIIALYGKSHPGHIVASFGSSNDLAKQIENGAVAGDFLAFLEGPEAREVFLSAGFSLIGSGAATN
jgi:molybdate transport system substrate-binding protein